MVCPKDDKGVGAAIVEVEWLRVVLPNGLAAQILVVAVVGEAYPSCRKSVLVAAVCECIGEIICVEQHAMRDEEEP